MMPTQSADRVGSRQQPDIRARAGTPAAITRRNCMGKRAMSCEVIRKCGVFTRAPAELFGGYRSIGLYDIGFDATWEVDMFGGTRRA